VRRSAAEGAEAGAPVPGEQTTPLRRATRLTRWAWVMLPMLVVSLGVGYGVGTSCLSVLGLQEGQLLMQAGPWGWSAALLVVMIVVLPSVAGVVLGRRAIREGAGRSAVGALVMNAVLLTYLILVQILQLIFV
jgi:hypothetical protein